MRTFARMRKLLLFLLLLPLMVWGEAIGTWQVYPAYTIATRTVAAGKSLYTLTGGNLLRYDTDDETVRTYNSLDDLNDVSIQYIDYSTEAHRLIIVYANGNIDLLDADDRVTNIAALRDKVMNNKDVRSLYVSGRYAYLTTGFGFLVVDMQEATITKTYQLGRAVYSMCIAQGRYYLSQDNGVYSIPLDGNLYDTSAYKKEATAGKSLKLVESGGKVYTQQTYYLYQIGRGIVANGKQLYLEKMPDGTLLSGNDTIVWHTTPGQMATPYKMKNKWADVALVGKDYWVADKGLGLRPYRLTDEGFQATGQQIQPNSPARDLFYRMHYEGERLLVAGGQPSYFGINYDPTAMYYEDGTWTNFSEDYGDMAQGFTPNNFTHIAQDPQDPAHHFVGTFRKGLYEYRDGRCVKIYNCDNSPIRSILPDNANYLSYCGTMGATYDADGRLWMLNNETDTIVRLIDTNGRWRSLYYPEIAATQTPTDYLFTRSGVNFIVSRRMEGRGFFAFHTAGTLTTTRDDHHILRTTLTNEDNTQYTPDEFYALAEDLDGQVWCGTNLGLFVIEDPTTYFDNDFRFNQIKIARDDGSGLADYLLTGVAITAIAVDGGNRKWIGTASNGLYLVSADGQEMIHHFQAADSPLLSDFIQSIAIHPRTGLVMIGTDKGLCSYMADAATAEPELAYDNIKVYPNPVDPAYNGPITIDGLTRDSEIKITTSTGQLIASGVSAGGRYVWDGLTHDGRRPASGVYQIIANTKEGKKAVVARIVMIR